MRLKKKNFLYKIIGKKISFQTSNNVPEKFLDDIFSVQFVLKFGIYNIRLSNSKLAKMANLHLKCVMYY